MMVDKQPRPHRKPVTVFLSQDDFDRLTAICKERGQSRADFLRGAMQVADQVPNINTRPLAGICLIKHKAKLRREEEAARRRARKGE